MNAKNYLLDKKNWLKYFLIRKDPSLIGYALQLSRVIDYYYIMNEETGFELNSARIGMDEIRNRLFELSINTIFNKNNIKTRIHDFYSYVDSSTGAIIEKPLDSSFIFNNRRYIIECKKVYDSKAGSLLETVSQIVQDILLSHLNNLNVMHIDTMPSGYVFFDENAESSVVSKTIRKDFASCYNEYMQGLSYSNNILTPKIMKITKHYEICIELSLLNKFEEYKTKSDSHNLAILFRILEKIANSKRATMFVEAVHIFTETEFTSRLRRLIQEKIDQHKNTNYQKIIFIDLEEDTSLFDKVPQYFNIDEINGDRIRSLLKEDVSICLLSRRYRNGEVYSQMKLFESKYFDPNLAKAIEDFKF